MPHFPTVRPAVSYFCQYKINSNLVNIIVELTYHYWQVSVYGDNIASIDQYQLNYYMLSSNGSQMRFCPSITRITSFITGYAKTTLLISTWEDWRWRGHEYRNNLKCWEKHACANSEDPDQTPQNAASDQGLHDRHSSSSFQKQLGSKMGLFKF